MRRVRGAPQKQIQGVVDAEDAMALSIDDGEPDMFRVLVGETFVSVSESAALEYIATRKAVRAREGRNDEGAREEGALADLGRSFLLPRAQKLEEQAAAIRGELDHIESRQAELKASLYARFGKAINLEE